uniref:uncharacterized protein isoform X2 n=1 Tax=Semicossyphus pulcher TaxID=241346 RepID=UPI0037E76081
MRGDTATDNDVGADDNGEDAAATDAASGERRPSLVKLQHMLKKVSQSPFHNQYQTLVSSTSDSSGNESLHTQNGLKTEDNDLSPAAAQDGVNGDLARSNPFYSYYLESGSKGNLKEDAGRKSPEELNLDSVFVPPPDFQSSPLDLQTKSVENGAEFWKPQKAIKPNHLQGLSQELTFAQNTTTNGHFHDVTTSSPDFFKPMSTQTQNQSKSLQSKGSDLFEDEGVDLLQAAKGHDIPHAQGSWESNVSDKSKSVGYKSDNPFKSPSNNKDNPFQSTQPLVANPFSTATTNEVDFFQPIPTKRRELSNQEDHLKRSSKEVVDVFSPSSTSANDPFPSPITMNLFQDSFDDPFGTTPSKQYDPFQDVSNGTSDIFQPLPSKANDKNGSWETKLDVTSSPDLFKAMPSKSNLIQPKTSDQPQDIVLTTPEGTKHDILQPSPFSRARNLSMSPSQSKAQMTHVQTFKRPPKPLPRTRPQRTEKPPRPEKPPKPDKPPRPEKPPTPANLIEPEPPVPKTSPKLSLKGLPKPVIRHKPKTPESKETDAENNAVFENILLIGQEKCVEDWPEDSPELDPDFKPSGTLRLRRESYKMKGDSDGGSGEDQDGSGSHAKKKDRKLRMSLLSRRGSKDKFPDDTKEGESKTLPISRKSSKDYFSELNMSAGENEEEELNGMDYRKKQLKTKVNQLLRRASTNSSVPDGKHMNGHLPQESKDDDKKSVSKKNSIIRRWSEGTVLDGSTGEEEEGADAHHQEKRKKKMKIKFVPQRGFAITVEKDDEPKGVHGYTSRKGSKDKSQDEVLGAHGYTARKGSKDKSQDEVLGAYGYTPRKKSQDDTFDDVEEMKSQSLHSTSKADVMEDEELQRALYLSAELNGDIDPYGMEDVKPKPTKMKLLHVGRRSSKEDKLEYTSPQRKKSSFSAEELDDDELYGMDKLKKSKHKGPVPVPRKSKTANGQSEPIGHGYHMQQQASNYAFDEDDVTQTGSGFMSPEEMYPSDQDELDSCKPKKSSKLKVFKKHKAKSKEIPFEFEDPPGATSSDFMSEAAKAEWLAAQMDERALAGLEDEDDEGDTDSLMEWWNTVEQWDEVPSDEEDKVLREDESKSFSILADKVHRGLRVYNKVFTERAEVLWQSIIRLNTIADDISTFHHKAKIAGITGGTTTAVGGVTAIAGLALAPLTLGVSLVITAVGVGVATAGGIASASAAISDNVNNMHDRKKVEIVLEEYEGHLLVIGKILHFVNQGLYKLRGHPFLRSGTQHYSKDWEIRRAVQMISLVDSPIMRAKDVTDTAVAAVQGLFGGMDKYFVKDSRELKKGCKKEVVAQIKEVATVLNDGIVELNAIREELQDATGSL